MPKTIFKVTDRTGSDALWTESHVVYIPCAAKYEAEPSAYDSATNYKVGDKVKKTVSSTTTYYVCIKDGKGQDPSSATTYWESLGTTWTLQTAVDPKLFINVDDLKNERGNYTEDEGFKAALYLLEIGLPVLLEGVLTTIDGTASGQILDPDSTDPQAYPVFNWTRLKDKNLYDIKFITTGKWDGIKRTVTTGQNPTSTCNANLAKAIDDLAEARKDCIAIINIPTDLVKATEIRDCVDNAKVNDEAYTIDWERAAAFVPAVKINNSNLASLSWVHGTWNYLGAYGYAIKNNPSWYAAAGKFRGTNPDVVDVKVNFNLADIEVLQARSKTTEVDLDANGDNIGIAINPIATINPYGILVWGNRTLKNNKDANGGTTGAGVLKASSFLNIECMVATINKKLYQVANKYRFEPNSDILWFNVEADIIPLLNKIKSGNGINAYKLERVESNARGRIIVRVTLVPIEAVEDFVFEVDLVDLIG